MVLVHYSYFLSPDSRFAPQNYGSKTDLLDFRHDFVGVPAGGRLHAPGEAEGARLDFAALGDPAARGAPLPARSPAPAATRQRQRSIVAPAPNTAHAVLEVFFLPQGQVSAMDLSSVADPDPGSGAFLTTGSGMGRKSASGSGMNNPDNIFSSLETNFIVLKFFDADPGSEIEKIRIREPG
jgi:hypothetical protein